MRKRRVAPIRCYRRRRLGRRTALLLARAAGGGFAAQDAANAFAVGDKAAALLKDSVALGSGALANTEAGRTAYLADGKDTAEWKSTHNAVAVGNGAPHTYGYTSWNGSTGSTEAPVVTRQITGVAGGSEPTDAVNVAQLKAAILAAGQNATYTIGTDPHAAAAGIVLDSANNRLDIVSADGFITTAVRERTLRIGMNAWKLQNLIDQSLQSWNLPDLIDHIHPPSPTSPRPSASATVRPLPTATPPPSAKT